MLLQHGRLCCLWTSLPGDEAAMTASLCFCMTSPIMPHYSQVWVWPLIEWCLNDVIYTWGCARVQWKTLCAPWLRRRVESVLSSKPDCVSRQIRGEESLWDPSCSSASDQALMTALGWENNPVMTSRVWTLPWGNIEMSVLVKCKVSEVQIGRPVCSLKIHLMNNRLGMVFTGGPALVTLALFKI